MNPSDADPAYLIMDTESVPDGKLLSLVKYPREGLSPEEAIQRAQQEARDQSRTGSDFLGATFMYPVAVCIIRVDAAFHIQRITCLDAPQYRPREICRSFWEGISMGYARNARLVTFNGRGFDLPLLELAAFRWGLSGRDYFRNGRNRYNGHIDLLDWLNNYGGCRHSGGLNLLSKLLGKPGKMETSGDQVYSMYREGKIQEINDYCMFDTLDTYFVLLRSRVMTGELTLEQEHELVAQTREILVAKLPEQPALSLYLDNWGDWNPWP